MNETDLIYAVELTSHWVQLLFALFGAFGIFGAFIIAVDKALRFTIP